MAAQMMMMMMSQIMSERDCLGWLIDINHFTSLVVLANSIVIRIQDGSQFKLSVYTMLDIHPSYNNLILLSSLSYNVIVTIGYIFLRSAFKFFWKVNRTEGGH